MGDVITNASVCVSEVTTTTAALPQPLMSDQPRNATVSRAHSASYSRRSDPYVYRGTGSQSAFAVSRPQGQHYQSLAIVNSSVIAGNVVTSAMSTVSNHQRPSDAIASGLAYLRGTVEQPLQTFGMSTLASVYFVNELFIFTTRCTLVQSAVLLSYVVRLSVRLSVCDFQVP